MVMQEQPEVLEMKRFQAPVENTQITEPMPHQPNHVSDASQRLKQYCEQHKDPMLSPSPAAKEAPEQDVSPKRCCTVM